MFIYSSQFQQIILKVHIYHTIPLKLEEISLEKFEAFYFKTISKPKPMTGGSADASYRMLE